MDESPLTRCAPFVLTMLLAGCTSVSVPQPFAGRLSDGKVIQLDYCIASTATQNAFSRRFGNTQNPERFASDLKLAAADIEAYAGEHMPSPNNMRIAYVSPCPDRTDTSASGADLLLEIQLSGYGSVKSRWKTYLIGTGIIEGVFQGIVASAATGEALLGIGVAAEEVLSEYLTWNGVDWLLGETYAPVTMEGRLISTRDGKTVWRHIYFVRNNDKELKGLSKEAKKAKSLQLQASLHKAERKLFKDLNGYVQKEIANGR